jgi:TatA/E family protein of Tat protein translocase
MLNIGPQELLLILLVALLVVGPKRLPELSRTIGRGLREFRKAQDEVTKTIRLGLDEAEPATRKPTGASGTGDAAKSAQQEAAATGQPAPDDQAPEDENADIARTLGRGLSEIRRARREIQQSFRVDLTDRPPRSSARKTPSRATPTSGSAPPETSSPSPGGTEGPSGPTPEQPAVTPPPADPEDPAQPTEPA